MESCPELYPWQQEQWQRLLPRLRDKTLPHALLLTGIAGLGKNNFARLLANSLICEQHVTNEMPCGVCRNCELFLAGTHPDMRIVKPNEDGKSISIDQIRELHHAVNLRTQGYYKTVIITPAEQMPRNAANALLKTLEEPAGNAVIMLVTHRLASLPLTVRSRCQCILFRPPGEDAALHWLKGRNKDEAALLSALALTDGAPLAALELVSSELASVRQQVLTDIEALVAGRGDPVAFAESWYKHDAKSSLHWLHRITIDLVRLGSSPRPPKLYNKDAQKRLQEITNRLELTGLHALLIKISKTLRLSDTSANTQMLVEDLLIAWQTVAMGKPIDD